MKQTALRVSIWMVSVVSALYTLAVPALSAIPATGDSSNIGLVIGILVVSVIVIAVLLVVTGKKGKGGGKRPRK